MPRKNHGPPRRLHETGKKNWYEKHNVTCDVCHRPATVRWRNQNLCSGHLNRPYKDVKLGDGTSYLQEVESFVTTGKSPAGYWEES